ncbi:MAG: hypothetical protein Q9223_004669 [Gallowayella weberi]
MAAALHQYSDDEEFNAQLEREGLSQHYTGIPEPISSDEDSSPSTPQPPINPITTDTEPASLLNQIALPSQPKRLSKRKRSASEDQPALETNKRSKTENSSHHVADDPSRGFPGKLNRPTPGLVHQKASVEIKGKDPFGVPDATTSSATASRARSGRPPKSAELQAQEGQPRSGPKPRDQLVGEGETRQLRSQKRAAILSTSPQLNPGNRPDVAHGSRTDQNGVNIPGSSQSQAHDAPEENQFRAGSPQQEPVEEAELDIPASTEQAKVRQASHDSATESEGSAEQTSLDEHEDASKEPHPQDSSEQADHKEVLETAVRGIYKEGKPELFGQDCLWREIHEARRRIGRSKVQGDTIREIPKLQTGLGKRMDRLIKTASQIYDPNYQAKAKVERHDHLERLTVCIEELSESSCQDEEREVVQDLYAHTIPKLVLLLEKALQARSPQLSDRKDITALKEIIHLQGLLLTMCKKARVWKARPVRKTSIVRPAMTIGKIMETIRKAFKKQLEIRRRKIAMRAAKANKPAEIDEFSSQQAWEAAKRKAEALRQRILDDCRCRNATQWGRRPIPQSQSQQPSPQLVTTPNVVEGWSREQTRALVVELLRKDHRDLTGKTYILGC